MGQANRPGHVTGRKHRWAADIEQHEVRTFGQGIVDVPAIGLEGELGSEMGLGELGGGWWNGGDKRLHEVAPFISEHAVERWPLAIGANDNIRIDHAKHPWSVGCRPTL